MWNKGKNKEKSLIIVFIACLIVSLSSISFLAYKIIRVENKSPSIFSLLKNRENEMSINIKDKKGITSIKISFIGDCTLGSKEGSKDETFNYAYNEEKDDKYFFSGVVSELKKDDLTIANLEGTFSDKGKKSKNEVAFKGNPNYSRILKQGSIEVVNLANDHTDDYGYEGLNETKQSLEKEGIRYFGHSDKLVVEVKGIKVGILGYKEPDNIKKTIEYDITNMRKKVDLLIVSFHWGENKSTIPNDKQKGLGKQVIDLGTDIVVGHHPHVIQGIETYKDKKIVYSLGSFISGGDKNIKDKDSFIYKQEFIFDSNKKIISTSKEEKIPILISSRKDKNDYKPIILKGKEKERVNKKIEDRSILIK